MRTRTLIVHVDWASSKIISFGDSFPTVKPRSLYIWFKRTFLIVTVPMSSFEVILSSGCNAWYSWSKYSGFSNRSRNTLSFVARFAVVCVSLIVVSMSIQVYSFTNANSTYIHYILSETIWQDILLCTFTLCVGIGCKCFSSILKHKPYDFFNFSLSRGENKYDI